MNITFFNDIPGIGGGELWVLKMVAALQKRGHSASVICPWRSQLFQACVEAGHDVFGFSSAGGTPVREPLYHFLRSRETDVVCCTIIGHHCEAESLAGIVERVNRDRPANPAVLILKTGLPPARHLSPEYYGFGGPPLVRKLYVVSEEDRNLFLQWQQGADGLERFVEVMREGVDLSRFRRRVD